MKMINIGRHTMVHRGGIAQIIELADMAAKTILIQAKHEGRLKVLSGRPSRSAVFLYNGDITLTPLAARTIFTRMQEMTVERGK